MAEIDTQQNVFSISEAKVAKITKNTSTEYDKETYIDVPELSTMDVTVKTDTKEATYGAGQIADSFTIKQGFDVKFESVNIPLKAIEMINGAKLTQTGTEGSESNALVDSANDVPAMFNLAFKTDYVNGDPADFHMELYCVKGYLDVITKADDYWTCSFSGQAVGRKKDKHIREITANKTAANIGGSSVPVGGA